MTSSADLWEDGYPHGTVEGFNGGCRGAVCPSGIEWNMSCKRANTLAHGDYNYPRLVKQGKTPAEIAEILDHKNTGETSTKEPPTQISEEPERPKPAPPKHKGIVHTIPAEEKANIAAAAAEFDVEPDEPAPAGFEKFTPITTDKWTAGLTVKAKTGMLREIREWCRANGFPGVPTHGKIPQDALHAYDDAHNQVVVTALPGRPVHGGMAAAIIERRQETAIELEQSPATTSEPPETLKSEDVDVAVDALADGDDALEPSENGSALDADHWGDEPSVQLEETPQHKRCLEKVRFDNYVDANRVLADIQEKAAKQGRTEHVPIRSYHCPHCDGWHHTSQPRKGRPRPTPPPLTTAIADTVPTDVKEALEAATVAPPLPAGEFSEALEQVRERADAPSTVIELGAESLHAIAEAARVSVTVPDPAERPDWADVTVPQEIERLRNWAVHLEQELAEAERQRDAAQAASVLALRKWADMYTHHERTRQALAAEMLANQVLRGSTYAIADLRRRARSSRRRWKR